MIHSIGLKAAQEQKSGQYDIRTRHLDAEGRPLYVNHLIQEVSPYLLQHAHNPVHWRSWNDVSFQLAQEQKKPVFLSVGYSTCHWCHVMEEESFDDVEVAEYINENFVAIKLDREQRPDLDEVYMTALQVIRGNGGWPMSMFLTPQGAPFFGGTYYSKPQFLQVLQQVHALWQEERQDLIRQGAQLLASVRQYLEPAVTGQTLNTDLISAVAGHLHKLSDTRHGGFGQAPKFPQEPYLLFLLDQVARQPQATLADNPLWQEVHRALDAMLRGGIYDQVGGGFHRYAVDHRWQVPHFEKMLYNQAQLVQVYARAHAISGNPEYRRVVEETLAYVSTELRDEQGLFYSASDADSEGEEGRFFIWSQPELKMLLSAPDYALLCQCYQIDEAGNFDGKTVLNLQADLQSLALRLGLDYGYLCQRIREIRQCLYAHRAKRVAPMLDQKIITEWNGMMIAAFALAARLLQREDYYLIAAHAARQILRRHRREDGALWRLSLAGVSSQQALLEDYAQLLAALIALYDVQQDRFWLEQAMSLYCGVMELYWDKQAAGFFVSAQQSSGPLLVNSKNIADTATVSGNAMMLHNLQALLARSGELLLQNHIRRQVQVFAAVVNKNPLSSPVFLQGVAALKFGNVDDVQYAAGGAAWCRLDAVSRQQEGPTTIRLVLGMRPGCYVQTAAIGIQVQPQAAGIRLPRQERLTEPSAINLVTPFLPGTALSVKLTLQVCTEDSCHPPETMQLTVWV